MSAKGVRQVVIDRADQRCERCGRYLHDERASLHHRQLRSQGGPDTPENLVLLCGTGTTGCHGWVHGHPKEATAAGFMVPSWGIPAEVPIWMPHQVVLIGASYVEVEAPSSQEPAPATIHELLGEL